MSWMNILPRMYVGAADFTRAKKASFNGSRPCSGRSRWRSTRRLDKRFSDTISARSVEFLAVHVAVLILSPGGACDNGVILA
jgi:hypothetical protein